MVKISVIICTYNRKKLLKNCLESCLSLDFLQTDYEIIIVNNNSTDRTKKLVNKYQKTNKIIKYFFEKNPGLHNARHRGAKEAEGEILSYIDDDVIVSKNWLKEIIKTFKKNKKIDIVTGKILPFFEKTPPWWLKYFWKKTKEGKYLDILSLLDLGKEEKKISPNLAFGANFSIKKRRLYEEGGFHPDAFPKYLIKFRGDGETALASKIAERGIIFYNPKAMVKHFIFAERLTIDYFCQRCFNQGISDSFTEIRKRGGLESELYYNLIDKLKFYQNFLKYKIALLKNFRAIPEKKFLIKLQYKIKKAYKEGKKFHQDEVRKDRKLLDYVLKKNYLGYKFL